MDRWRLTMAGASVEIVLGCWLLVLATGRLLETALGERFINPSIRPAVARWHCDQPPSWLPAGWNPQRRCCVKRHSTLSGYQGRVRLPPKAARAEGPPRTRPGR